MEPGADAAADAADPGDRRPGTPGRDHPRRPGRRAARPRGSSPAVDLRSRRALVLQGLLRVVEATAPSLVLVDDLQWADSSSLDLLALLAGRSSDVTMVVAYRPEEVAEDSPWPGSWRYR